MFGREPQLSIDFLLGRVEKPRPGPVCDWVAEHQTPLRLAYDGARERLRAAAHKRKHQHDATVRDVSLMEGQRVLLCDYGVRGRNKIQDKWHPLPYKVLRAPEDGGQVYTIAPSDDPAQVRYVHRSALKPYLGIMCPNPSPRAVTAPEHATGLGDQEGQDEDPWEEDDLSRVLPASAGVVGAAPIDVEHLTPNMAQGAMGYAGSSLMEPPPEAGGSGTSGPRRTTRETAGRHSNPYHLPRSVGGELRGAANSPGAWDLQHDGACFQAMGIMLSGRQFRKWAWIVMDPRRSRRSLQATLLVKSV